MATKNAPGNFDCYAHAEPNEPIFILLGRDPTASFVVAFWRELRVKAGLNSPSDEQIVEAMATSKALAEWALSKGKAEKVRDAFGVVGELTK